MNPMLAVILLLAFTLIAGGLFSLWLSEYEMPDITDAMRFVENYNCTFKKQEDHSFFFWCDSPNIDVLVEIYCKNPRSCEVVE